MGRRTLYWRLAYVMQLQELELAIRQQAQQSAVSRAYLVSCILLACILHTHLMFEHMLLHEYLNIEGIDVYA